MRLAVDPGRSYHWRERIFIVLACVAAVVVLSLGCTSPGKAAEALRGAGYRDISVGGWSAWRCAKDDETCTKFEATGPSGERVYGAVGCGYMFKGCTIRISGGHP